MKPENILISNDNGTYSIKLSDFGISKDLNSMTSTLNAPGTFAWIAPEVLKKGHVRIHFKLYVLFN